MITIDAQIFLGTIFRGLNFRGDKFLRVVVAHKNFNPHKKLFTSSTRDRNGAAWGRCRVSKDALWQGD